MKDKTIIRRFYDEDGLVNLIMDLLCTDNERVWLSETGKDRLEIHISANSPNVRDRVRDWLLVKERLINDKMMITRGGAPHEIDSYPLKKRLEEGL